MSVRKIERTRTFADNLKNLSKKYAGLSSAVDAALNQYAATGESATSFRLIRVKGLPVFKDRLAFGNRGKRGAARIVYYCDPERVLALFLFAKSKQEDVPIREIRGRLEIGRSPRKWRIATRSGWHARGVATPSAWRRRQRCVPWQ